MKVPKGGPEGASAVGTLDGPAYSEGFSLRCHLQEHLPLLVNDRCKIELVTDLVLFPPPADGVSGVLLNEGGFAHRNSRKMRPAPSQARIPALAELTDVFLVHAGGPVDGDQPPRGSSSPRNPRRIFQRGRSLLRDLYRGQWHRFAAAASGLWASRWKRQPRFPLSGAGI